MRKFFPAFILVICSPFAVQTLSAQEADANTVMLETFGAVSGIMIYNTYIVIGTVADGFDGEVYDSAAVITYMDEQVGVLQNMADQFRRVHASNYMTDPGDQEFLVELESACNLLRDEAQALIVYVGNLSDQAATDFQNKRSQAWDKIAYLLDIE